MTKLIAAFYSFAKAPENYKSFKRGRRRSDSRTQHSVPTLKFLNENCIFSYLSGDEYWTGIRLLSSHLSLYHVTANIRDKRRRKCDVLLSKCGKKGNFTAKKYSQFKEW